MTEEEEDHTKIFKAVVGFLIMDLAFYLVLLLVALYITARFLIWHKKGKIVFVGILRTDLNNRGGKDCIPHH